MAKYLKYLGELSANLFSLEFSLRVFLLERENYKGKIDYNSLKVGDSVDENAFTNWDTLGTLIEKYNCVMKPVNPKFCISDSVVDLRDALAHGRVSSDAPAGPIQILKFSKPDSGKTTVTFSSTMDETWFKERIKFSHTQVRNLIEGSKVLGMNAFT